MTATPPSKGQLVIPKKIAERSISCPTVDPEILLIDEVLAVGDVEFQAKCLDQIRSFNESGKVILIGSRGMEAVRKMCHRVIWLKDGVTMAEGPASKTVDDDYLEHYWPGRTGRTKT